MAWAQILRQIDRIDSKLTDKEMYAKNKRLCEMQFIPYMSMEDVEYNLSVQHSEDI